MSWEPFEWENENGANWALIKNKYGELLSYNLPRYHKSYASCGYQGYITEMIESKKYGIFIDCGAYIGLFSLIASYNCKAIYAYEAHPFYYGILLANMRFRFNVFCEYSYITKGLDYIRANPTMEKDIKGLINIKGTKAYKIHMTSLDEEHPYDLSYNRLIKVDVEGNEINVLLGSEKLLENPKTHWIIDIHTQHGIDPKEIAEFFPNRKKTWISPKVLKVEGAE